MNRISINLRFQIPASEIYFTFARSSGPGGQNVNKVNSKAVLHWNIIHSPTLNSLAHLSLRALLIKNLATKISQDGELIINSDHFRDQPRNRDACIEKLIQTLKEASHVPKTRKKTKPSKARKNKNLDEKKVHSKKKRLRQAKNW